MARRVRISTIGAPPPSADGIENVDALVKKAIDHWRRQLDQVLPDKPDLIVIPEMCDTYDFSSHEAVDNYYMLRGDRVRDYFAATARAHGCYITYPAVRYLADGRRFNSVQLLDREGRVVGSYDKNHVVIGETTEFGVLCGDSAPVLECDFGRVAFAICFDLNFEPLRQQYVAAKADLLIFPSMFHGGLMQQYWAYTCRAHFVGAISGIQLSSDILSPQGEIIASSTNYLNYVTATVNLDCRLAHLDDNWEKLTELKRKYGPEVTIHDPGRMGSVLITSESEEVGIEEMVRSFGIELLDDYLARSLEHHCGAGSSRR